jgi:hypothetical protein
LHHAVIDLFYSRKIANAKNKSSYISGNLASASKKDSVALLKNGEKGDSQS